MSRVYGFMSSTLALAGVLALALPGPAAAQFRPYGGRGFGDPFGSSRFEPRVATSDDREGRVDAAQFAADGAARVLGRGAVQIQVLPESTPDARTQLDYEAAVLDRLGAEGYDISGNGDDAAQIARIRIIRDVAEPAEQKRSPVSGETAIGVSNRGTSMGMAVNLDFTKPRKALMSTKMTLQIVDRATDAVLWEARAQMFTRDQDEDWTESDVARRLAAALVEGFPTHTG